MLDILEDIPIILQKEDLMTLVKLKIQGYFLEIFFLPEKYRKTLAVIEDPGCFIMGGLI